MVVDTVESKVVLSGNEFKSRAGGIYRIFYIKS